MEPGDRNKKEHQPVVVSTQDKRRNILNGTDSECTTFTRQEEWNSKSDGNHTAMNHLESKCQNDQCDKMPIRNDSSHGGEKENDECPRSFKEKLLEFTLYQSHQQYLDVEAMTGVCPILDCKKGRELFIEAMYTPYMESFFTISNQIENQQEYTCAHSTLVSALNSLCIDPGRPTWYDEWRWHCLDSLACCTLEKEHLDTTKEQFARLAICNDARAYYVTVNDTFTVETFRDWVKLCTSRKDLVLVINFSRSTLHQRGLGHYSPVVGYHEGQDMLLISEVSKYKYPSYWVDMGRMVDAMRTIDKQSGKSRGFVIMCGPDYAPADRIFGLSLLFRVDVRPGNVESSLTSFVSKWKKCLDAFKPSMDISEGQIVGEATSSLVSSLPTDVISFSLMNMTLVAFRHVENGHPSIVARCSLPHDPKKCKRAEFIKNLNDLRFFQYVRKQIVQLSINKQMQLLDLVKVTFKDIDQALEFTKDTLFKKCAFENVQIPSMMQQAKEDFFCSMNGDVLHTRSSVSDHQYCPGYIQLLPEHVTSILMLSWPYLPNDEAYINDQITPNRIIDEITSTNNMFKSHSLDNVAGTNSVTDGVNKVSKYICDVIDSELNREGMTRLGQEVRSLSRKLRVTLTYHDLL